MAEAERLRAAQEGDALEHVLRGLATEARKPGEPPVVRRILEVTQGLDAAPLPNRPDPRHPESRDAEHLDQARRDLLAELLEHLRPAALHQLPHDREPTRASPFRLGERAVRERRGRLP